MRLPTPAAGTTAQHFVDRVIENKVEDAKAGIMPAGRTKITGFSYIGAVVRRVKIVLMAAKLALYYAAPKFI